MRTKFLSGHLLNISYILNTLKFLKWTVTVISSKGVYRNKFSRGAKYAQRAIFCPPPPRASKTVNSKHLATWIL